MGLLRKIRPEFVFALVSLAVLGKLLLPGYVLTLDMVFPPYVNFQDKFYGLSEFYPVYVDTELPLYFLIEVLSKVMPMWLVQKIILFSILFLSGISAYRLCPTEQKLGKYFAGFLYMVNPFIYIRFLAGHWKLLLGYAVLPFALKAFLELLDGYSTTKFLRVLFWITVIGVFNIHILILTLFILSGIFLFKVMENTGHRNIMKLLKIAAALALFYVVLNAYWILPLTTAETNLLSQIGQEDLRAFAPRVLSFSIAYTVASMYGFWRGGYVYAKDVIPYSHFLFIGILFLAVYGFVSHYKDKKKGSVIKALALVAIVSLVLGTGFTGPFSSIFEYLYNHLQFFNGFRDSHKFVVLLVLSYSYLGGLGIGEMERHIKEVKCRGTKYLSALVLIVVFVPFIYSFTMFNGFYGQLESVEYPEDWHKLNEYLTQDKEDFNILFFPWHGYMTFSWTKQRVINPAMYFFEKPVIQGKNIEMLDIYTHSTEPTQRYIEFLLMHSSEVNRFGRLVTPLNVKYIVLAKEVDYKKYLFLFNQSDLELIKDTEYFYVFRNKNKIAKIYGVDDVSYIDSWNELLKIIKNEDISNRVYLMGNDTLDGNSSNGIALEFEKKSPIKYMLKEKPNKKYIIFTEAYSTDWEFDGVKPIKNFDVTNAYRIDGVESPLLEYKRFKIYIAGYIISLLSFIALLYYSIKR